jgi:DNA-directed RNA polymerase subunit RPC12/RpoP
MNPAKFPPQNSDPRQPEVACPKCGKSTRKIVVDVERIDWPSAFFIGLWALLFSSRVSREFQCQHCGKTFAMKHPPMTGRDRLIGLCLLSFCGMMIVAVAWLIFWSK